MKYPEHEKLEALGEDTQKLGYFLEWLKRKYDFYQWEDWADGEVLKYVDINKTLAEYFEIDYDKLMQEKEEMLEEIRKANR